MAAAMIGVKKSPSSPIMERQKTLTTVQRSQTSRASCNQQSTGMTSHEADQRPTTVAFVFSVASGHINPSLPVARALVAMGVEVHYLVPEIMEAPVKATGATFHSQQEWQPEYFQGHKAEPTPVRLQLLGAVSQIPGAEKFGSELLLRETVHMKAVYNVPGTVRWLQHIKAQSVVYDPILALEALVAARHLKIPAISILTTAGPGSLANETVVGNQAWVARAFEFFTPHLDAVRSLNETYSLEPPLPAIEAVPFMNCYSPGPYNLVTTAEGLADPCSKEATKALKAAGIAFHYVGPLLGGEGERQAGPPSDGATESNSSNVTSLIAEVRAAKARGARVVYASMGTVITSSFPKSGWTAAPIMKDGTGRNSLSGKELCQAAWNAIFETFGSQSSAFPSEWLVVVGIGHQPDALEGMTVPSNVIYQSHVAQQDLLREGVDLFLTHGGQNSFMESMSAGVPVVVCPGFGDQPVNAAKAQNLGVGLMVERAAEGCGDQYRQEVAGALRRVATEPAFRERAQAVSESMSSLPGVPGAVKIILKASSTGKQI